MSRTKGILSVVAALVVLAAIWMAVEITSRTFLFPPHVAPPPPPAVAPGLINDPVSRTLVALPMESATRQPLMMPSKRLALETKEDSVQFFLDVEIPEATRKERYQLHFLVEAGHEVKVVPSVTDAESIHTRPVRPPLRFLEEGGIENVMWDEYIFDFGQRETLFPYSWSFGLIVPPKQRFRVTAVTYPSAILTR